MNKCYLNIENSQHLCEFLKIFRWYRDDYEPRARDEREERMNLAPALLPIAGRLARSEWAKGKSFPFKFKLDSNEVYVVGKVMDRHSAIHGQSYNSFQLEVHRKALWDIDPKRIGL